MLQPPHFSSMLWSSWSLTPSALTGGLDKRLQVPFLIKFSRCDSALLWKGKLPNQSSKDRQLKAEEAGGTGRPTNLSSLMQTSYTWHTESGLKTAVADALNTRGQPSSANSLQTSQCAQHNLCTWKASNAEFKLYFKTPREKTGEFCSSFW